MEEAKAAEEAATFRDWADLPGDLLTCIGELVGVPGRLCFRGVCRSWSAALPAMPSPWLVVPDGWGEYRRHRFTFLSLPTRSSLRWTLPGARCVGSSGGWLALVDVNLTITLLNPLTYAQVRLPPLRREGRLFPLFTVASDGSVLIYGLYSPGRPRSQSAETAQHRLIQKVAFSPNPTAQDYAVAVLCRSELGLAFTRSGCDCWQWLDWPDAAGRSVPQAGDSEAEDDINVDLDVVYHSGKFYYMTLCGQIWAIDAAGPPPVAPVPFAKCRPPGPDHLRYGKHLVVTDDGVLHVVWSDGPGLLYPTRARAMRMRVQRYEPGSTRVRRWRKVRHLGGRAFLIGNRSQSMAVPTSSRSTWLRPNCVYFTDNIPGSDEVGWIEYLEQDIWEFDMETGEFRPCDREGLPHWLEWPKAMWFTPSVP